MPKHPPDSDTRDEFVCVPESELSLVDIGNAGIIELKEIRECGVNDHDREATTHSVFFRRGGRLVVTYAKDGTTLRYEAFGVQFWRLGDEIFVGEARP